MIGALSALAVDLFFGIIFIILGQALCLIMTQDPAVIELALVRMNILCATFCLGGIMEVLTYSLRSLGKSTTAMMMSIIFVCVFRVFWINTFYNLNPTFAMIFYSYPISWLLSIIADIVILVPTIKKFKKSIKEEKGDVSHC